MNKIADQQQITNLLLAFIAGMLFKHFYPDEWAALGFWCEIALGVWFSWIIGSVLLHPFTKAGKKERRDKQRREERIQKMNDLRNKYDPNDEWDDTTEVPEAYSKELRELNYRYRDLECD